MQAPNESGPHDVAQLIGRCKACGEQLRALDLLLQAQEMRLLPRVRSAQERLDEVGLTSPQEVQRAYDALDIYERRQLEAELGLRGEEPGSGPAGAMRKRLQSMV